MESPRLLWTPDSEFKEQSNIGVYMRWLEKNKDLYFSSYHALWKWSVENPEAFWTSLWEYFEVMADGTYKNVMEGEMPTVKWFEGTKLNYAEHIFRKASNQSAIIYKSESEGITEISWLELEKNVGSIQNFLRHQGVEAGDCIAAYLPCIPEASVAMLAATSLGAIWSSASPDFGTQAVIDRFTQIEPKVLFAVSHYSYNGKRFDKNDVIQHLIEALPSLRCVVVVTETLAPEKIDKIFLWKEVSSEDRKPEFVRVPFNHPLWILYSSGTTGLPKAITHSHGGILLEQLKYGTFHNDFKPGDRCFWYTTTGWMMWNYIHGSLLAGATMVLYDGSPAYPTLNVLWKFAHDTRVSHFGTSAAFILANMKNGIRPADHFEFPYLRSIGSTGSTLPPEGFDWVYSNVKNNLWLASMSGGTDVCSAFVGGIPTQSVYAGEIQCRALGCSLEAFDEEGKPLQDEVGEMVITQPMPSMPIYFWNDPEFKRYTESYFEMYPGLWRHGDWIQITPRDGVIIYGRSDATLNRGGVRIGTSEVYRSVDKIKEVKDSLILSLEIKGGEFWMPLFVVMQEGQTLSEQIRKKINATIKDDNSPRHVPDEIIVVPDIPYTISGKKTETPVKKILMGKDPGKVVNEGSLKNPESMNYFIELAKAIKP